MYTIRQASLRSGVSIPLVRAWERRYGVVRPERTSGGYRVYDDEAVATLQAMRRLVDEGWQPSVAAAALRAGSAPVSASTPSVGAEPALLAQRFAAAATRYDREAIESLLDEMTARGTFEATVDEFLLPAVASLGDLWERGRLDVAAEHAASAAVMRRLAAAFDAAGRTARGPLTIVGMPPNGRHELGALAFAIALRRRGIAVVYLGPDVPVGSWVHAVSASGAAAAVVGAVTADDADAARSVAEAVHAKSPKALIAVGGDAAELLSGVPGLTVLPRSVVRAAAQVDNLLR
jgi:DNA-binding transcriptional MerR regulator/methylmalonyl-CoA mutase cobalamin-binding subunit